MKMLFNWHIFSNFFYKKKSKIHLHCIFQLNYLYYKIFQTSGIIIVFSIINNTSKEGRSKWSDITNVDSNLALLRIIQFIELSEATLYEQACN